VVLSEPHPSGREERYLRDATAGGPASTRHLESFEREFAAEVGRPAVALTSGTAALHLGLRLAGVGPGDEVFVSDLAPPATAAPVEALGAVPIPVDSDRRNWMLSAPVLAEALDERARRGALPRAVLVAHLYGQCADMDPILSACARHGVPVVEDAAESLGSQYHGRPAGSLGDAGAFSFGANKVVTTARGGMLVARREEWVERARAWAREAPRDAATPPELRACRMSNRVAAIGRAQLEVLYERVRQRRDVAFRYRDALSGLPGLSFMPQAAYGLHANWLSCFLVDPDAFGATRDDLLHALAAADVEARAVWRPLHLDPRRAGGPRYGGDVAEELADRGLCLPSSSQLSRADQDRVVEIVRGVARAGGRRTRSRVADAGAATWHAAP
jgi:pyridoxal phosphate-dependent aminotransferase EpsN